MKTLWGLDYVGRQYIAIFIDFGETCGFNKRSLELRIKNLKQDNLSTSEEKRALKKLEEVKEDA